MVLLVDNYDSFTFNLYDYFLQIGVNCRVIRNDEYTVKAVEKLNPQAIVFSPGPQTPRDAGNMLQFIKYFHQQIPLLGICLGHQAIGEFFGARLGKAKKPMHGKTSVVIHHHDKIFRSIPKSFRVMRYHSLILSEMEKMPLKVIAQTEEGEIMAIVHRSFPIYGFQFHPEAILTEYGLRLLKNWVIMHKLL